MLNLFLQAPLHKASFFLLIATLINYRQVIQSILEPPTTLNVGFFGYKISAAGVHFRYIKDFLNEDKSVVHLLIHFILP